MVSLTLFNFFAEEGHDSLEDAVSCVELMLWKVKEDMKVKERNIKQ